jgi:hypothetical protein
MPPMPLEEIVAGRTLALVAVVVVRRGMSSGVRFCMGLSPLRYAGRIDAKRELNVVGNVN